MNQRLSFQSKIKSSALDSSVQSILVRMERLAKDRFDVDVEFIFQGDDCAQKEEWIFSKLKTSPFLLFETESYFAIRIEKTTVGVVHVRGSLSEAQAQMMMEIVELIVSSTLKAALDLSSLEMLEGKMQLLNPDQNVLRMDQFQQKPKSLFHLFTVPQYQPSPKRFCRLISHQDAEVRRKSAYDIHEKTGNFAFLDFRELSDDAFSSHESFAELGAITLYVEEISELNACMQNFISEYLSSNQWTQGPSIALGSSYLFSEPQLEFMVEPDLYTKLKSIASPTPPPLSLN